MSYNFLLTNEIDTNGLITYSLDGDMLFYLAETEIHVFLKIAEFMDSLSRCEAVNITDSNTSYEVRKYATEWLNNTHAFDWHLPFYQRDEVTISFDNNPIVADEVAKGLLKIKINPEVVDGEEESKNEED